MDLKQAIWAKNSWQQRIVSYGQTQKQITKLQSNKEKNGKWTTVQKEFISQAVGKAARSTIQTMGTPSTPRPDNAGPEMSGPILKQPMFDWNIKD